MRRLEVVRGVWAKIEDVKRFTRANFGPQKLAQYEALIDEAFDDLRAGPTMRHVGTFRGREVFRHDIKKPGRNARHVFLYEILEDGAVRVLRFLHDAQDFKRHL